MSEGSGLPEGQKDEGAVDADRREVLGAIAKYAGVVGASTVVLSSSASVALAGVSGSSSGPVKPGGPRRRRRRRWIRIIRRFNRH